ncbi:hypothetical protein [Sandarakinorhabdus sp. DWP1-3-1]|uniref:hypothetical protein n=1 Tax=Sandarakinorhabdus sp. DWP1-3-1 TaxID=2804627 RepID=UPI003CEE00C1
MDLAPPRAFALAPPRRLDAPLSGHARTSDAEVALKFETLIAETLLRSARAAKLGDDGLGDTGDSIRDMVDHQRAEAIARAAPIGVARLLAEARK